MSKPVKFDIPGPSEHVKQKRQRDEMIRQDIDQIDSALENGNLESLVKAHRNIDGKYQACIKDWGKGLYGYHKEYGALYDSMDEETLKNNLEVMRPKLEAFLLGFNVTSTESEINRQDVSVVVNNTNVNLEISFEQAKRNIEEMPGLTQEETEEIIKKIDELEAISKESIPKKQKWARISPILKFVLDKSVDVATMVLSLFLQMNIK